MPPTSRLGLLSMAAILALAAQQRDVPLAPAPPGTLRITVTLVQVDAVVTDSKGRHVADLRPEDFEVLQDGVPHKLTHFSYIPQPPPSEPQVATHRPISPHPVRRAVAIVVDDLALSFESVVRTREALRKYIDQKLQPGDLVSIVRTGGGVAFLEQFTTDRRLLLEAVDTLRWRFNGRCCLGPITPIAGGRDLAAGMEILDYGLALSALGSLGTLEHVVRGMRRLPGRKSVVFLSESLRLDGRVVSAMDHLTDLANRSAVSLYTVDPAGLRVDFPSAADPYAPGDIEAGAMLESLGVGGTGGYGSHDGLNYLARRTGGLFFYNNNDIPGCIGRAVDDQLGYYLLGYSPAEGTFEESPTRARFHRLTVRVRIPGLTVRWKSGFSGVPDNLIDIGAEPLARTREQQLLEALASPFTATGLKVRLTSMFNHTAASGAFVRSLLHFDAGDLAFEKDAGGLWCANVDIVTSAYRGLKQTILQHDRRETIRLPEETYRQALREGFLYIVDTPMKEPGTFLMRAAVRDAGSKRIGSASDVVRAPDTRKGQLALTGVTVKLAPPEVLKNLKLAPKTEGGAGTVEPWSEGGPAVRRYRSGQTLLYSYGVINPQVKGPAKMPNLSSLVRLFHNGKLLYTSEPSPLSEQGRIDEKHVLGGGALHLVRLRPGEYLIQVVVTDHYARKKKGEVAAWTDFEVVPGPRTPLGSAAIETAR